MANIINAITSGAGGLSTTADASGIIAFQSNGTTVLTTNSTGAIGVGSSPSYGTSGQLLTSGGSAVAPTWSTISAGGMTLLGTLTTTSGTTQTLSGLTLTGYKQVQIVGSGISTTFVGGQAGGIVLSPNSVRLTNDATLGADTQDFFAFVDLATGICTSSYSLNAGSAVAPYVRNSGLLTSATSITLTATNSTSFDAGTVKIYGVA
jgi:hypothetical protein